MLSRDRLSRAMIISLLVLILACSVTNYGAWILRSMRVTIAGVIGFGVCAIAFLLAIYWFRRAE